MEAEHALKWLLGIERRRTAQARAAGNQLDVIILDRSVHSLLAHRYALEQIGRFNEFQAAWDFVEQTSIYCFPDIIIYLDIMGEIYESRNKGRFEKDSIFTNAAFNAGIRSYFQRLVNMSSPYIIWLDATMDNASLCGLMAKEMKAILNRRASDSEGEAL